MSNTAKKPRTLLVLLCIVMAAAIVVSAVLLGQRTDLANQVSALTAELDASIATWQAKSADKESLQATLTATEDAIREAELTIEESEAASAKLTVQIDELTASNTVLAGELETARATKQELDTQFAAEVDKASVLILQIEPLEEQVASLTKLTDYLTSQRDMYRNEYNAAQARNTELTNRVTELEGQNASLQADLDAANATIAELEAQAAANATVEEQPAEEQPAEEQPTEEQPAEEQPVEEQPAEEQPAEEQPTEEQPAEEQPAEEQPAEEPAEEQPAEEQPAEEQPAA